MPSDTKNVQDGIAAYERGDYAVALGIFSPLANEGDTRAEYGLGLIYANGRGAAQDYAASIKWFERAAAKGLADAQFSLGSRYYHGQGVAQDFNIAFGCFTKAAEQGHVMAQFNLAVLHKDGLAPQAKPPRP